MSLYSCHPGRGIVSPGGNPAQLDRAIGEDAKIAAGGCALHLHPGGQEGHPAVDPLQGNGQAVPSRNFSEESIQVARRGAIRPLDPEPVHIQMQHLKPGILGNLGDAWRNLGESRRAIEYHEERLTIAREIGDRRGEGYRWSDLSLG